MGRARRRLSWCRIAGVPVRVHWSVAIHPIGTVFGFAWFVEGPAGIAAAGAFLALVLVAVLLHEFAHIVVARRFGHATEGVLVLPFGCVAFLESEPRGSEEFWTALAGPAANGLLACVALGVHVGFCRPPAFCGSFLRNLTAVGVVSNLALMVFNLLPCYPMDGGRIVRSLLMMGVARRRVPGGWDASHLATRIVVRWVTWPVALAAIGATIVWTHVWTHLVVFVAVLALGEAEVRGQRAARASAPPGGMA